jgi:hypothetical protein
MDRMSDTSKTHYHIHWISSDRLDWECFKTYLEATLRALELAQPDEEFQIEEVITQCPLRNAKTASD